MHPILASRQRVSIYLAGWSLVGAGLVALYRQQASTDWLEAVAVVLPLSLVYAFICLAAWYVCRATPLRPSFLVRVVVVHAGAAILSSFLWLIMWETWTSALAAFPPLEEAPAHFLAQFPTVFAAGILLFIVAVMVHYLLVAFESSRQAETRELGLQVLAREAELKVLRGQIDPHFLFNSLHSISALTSRDPAAARRMCLLLADFLRSSLQLGPKNWISLDEEIALARHFLEIEKVRFGERLTVEVAVEADCGACGVPPLLLQPLVENAVRHGIDSMVEGGTIAVTARRDARYLCLTVENPSDPSGPRRAGTGVGLDNVKKRLRTLYGNSATIEVLQPERRFRVEIRFPVFH